MSIDLSTPPVPFSFEVYPPRSEAGDGGPPRDDPPSRRGRPPVHLRHVRRGRIDGRPLARARCATSCARRPMSSRSPTSRASGTPTRAPTRSSASSWMPASRASSRCAATRRPAHPRTTHFLGDLESAAAARAAHRPGAGRARAVHRGAHPGRARRRARRAAAARSTSPSPRSPTGTRARGIRVRGHRRAAREAGRGRHPRDHAAVLPRRRLPRVRRARRATPGVTHPDPARHHADHLAVRGCAACSSSAARRFPPTSRSRSRSSPRPRGSATSASPTPRASPARSSRAVRPASTSTRSTTTTPSSRSSAMPASSPTRIQTGGRTMTEPRPTFPHGTILGYPRIGRRRELKRAVEAHWAGTTDEATLEQTAAELRRATRERLAELGLGRDDSSIPESFSYYDQVLDAALTVGALPERFAHLRDADGVDRPRRVLHRRARRGRARAPRDDEVVRHELPLPRARDRPRDGLRPLERPLRAPGRRGEGRRLHRPPGHRRPGDAPRPREGDGCRARRASTRSAASTTCCRCTPSCWPALRAAGAEWVQLDEPALVSESLPVDAGRARGCRGRARVRRARRRGGPPRDPRRGRLRAAVDRGVDGARGRSHRGARDRPDPRRGARALSPGWRTRRSSAVSSTAATSGAATSTAPGSGSRRSSALGRRAIAAGTSTSLQHVPHDVADEPDARPAPRVVARVRRPEGRPGRRPSRAAWPTAAPPSRTTLAEASAALADRRSAPGRPRRRRARAGRGARRRPTSTAATTTTRVAAQEAALGLPVLPTTTIGSFPQTADIRRARARHDRGEITTDEYESFLRDEIARGHRRCRRSSASTSSCTASPSATTWCSTSPRTSTASR